MIGLNEKSRVIGCITCTRDKRCDRASDCLRGNHPEKFYYGWPQAWKLDKSFLQGCKYHHWEPVHPINNYDLGLNEELFEL
jgi:hypothetical protein